MTNKESKKALDLYEELRNMFFYHNKNLTQSQYYLISDIVDFLREASEKEYKKRAKQ